MEPRTNEWDLVIKVKYGDILRRIGAYVNGQLMDHNMSKLTAKIIGLFKFSPDADLILTYTDEDGDIVTLVDDDELRDAIINQHLNPLRIDVRLKSNSGSSSDARPEEASPAPTKSPQLVSQFLHIPSAVDEALHIVPEPFRCMLSNISHDVLNVASSQPLVTKLVENFSKLGLSNASQPSHGPIGESPGTTSGASSRLVDLNVNDGPKATNDQIPVTTVLPGTVSVNPVLKNIPKQHDSGNMTQCVGATAPTCADIYLDIPRNPNVSDYPSANDLLNPIWTTTDCLEPQKEVGIARRDGKSVIASTLPSFPPVNQTVVDYNSQNFGTLWPSVPFHNIEIVAMSGKSSSKQLPMNTAAPSTSQNGLNTQDDVPISRHVGAPTADVPPVWSLPMRHTYRRSHSHHDNIPHTFHGSVQCDGCGIHPIVGSRFKSNVKEDYDLCSICFSQMGNEADYTRIDRASYRAPSRELYNPHSRYQFPSSHAFHGWEARSSRAKLESRFIQDVTVLDGTVMPPSTHFTKIWRMRNNGTIAWPFGTQLLWVSGDRFGDRGSTELEISVNGCPVDEEIDIAVDFTAPSRSGRYVSYWRLASPSGQKFGQRVWVLIQVDNYQPNSTAGSGLHAGFNLNLPPEISGRNGLGIIDVNADPMDGGVCPESNFNTSTATEEVVKPLEPSGLVEPALVADGFVGARADDGLAQPTPASALYPVIDISASLLATFDSSPAVAVAEDGNPVEQSLLKELEEMGFNQIDLNKEILRLNDYNLEQCVDDLCGFAEWDPLLGELQEMGFSDKELNKKLLIKNGGIINRAVLDLIAGGKAE